jgi:hypothetical protein
LRLAENCEPVSTYLRMIAPMPLYSAAIFMSSAMSFMALAAN